MKRSAVIMMIIIIVIYLAICSVLLFVIYPKVEFGKPLSYSEWIVFLGSFVGGALGGLGTLIAMTVTVINALNIQKVDRNNRENEQRQSIRIELTNSVAEYLGTYITHITNYDNNASKYWELEAKANRLQQEYECADGEYRSYLNQIGFYSGHGFNMSEQQMITKRNLENKLEYAHQSSKCAQYEFDEFEKYSDHLEANEAYFVIKAKIEHIDEAIGLVSCLEEVHNNAGNEHESRVWIEDKTKQLIEEYQKFKYAYVGAESVNAVTG